MPVSYPSVAMSQASERHPSANEIVAFASGELAPAEQTRIGAHVDGCERCAEMKTAVLEVTKKYQASGSPTGAGPAGDARTQSERLPLSPEHEHLLTMLSSPASLKTLAGELHVSVARLRRQVREAREFICDHNPRLLQKSYRALESALGTDDDSEASTSSDAKASIVDTVDREASEQFLSRHFGAVNVGIHRAVYSADDDAEWERVLVALLSGLLAPESAPAPAEITAVVPKPPAPAATDEMEWSSADGTIRARVTLGEDRTHYLFTHADRSLDGTALPVTVSGRSCTLTWAEDADGPGVRAEVDLGERVERPTDVEISNEAPAAAKGRRARGRR
jgi:hypothetical protein